MTPQTHTHDASSAPHRRDPSPHAWAASCMPRTAGGARAARLVRTRERAVQSKWGAVIPKTGGSAHPR